MHIKALAAGAVFGFVPAPGLQAETLRFLNGSAVSTLRVPMNRAVVVETDTPFAELSIANPGIADISTLSDRSIYVKGFVPCGLNPSHSQKDSCANRPGLQPAHLRARGLGPQLLYPRHIHRRSLTC